MRYYIRPTFEHLEFKSRQDALVYINQRPVYQNIKHWVASDTDGTWRIYCNKGVYLNKDQLSNFPKPYKIILTDYYYR